MKDTIKIDRGNVKMIAHRGASFIERENTAAAFIAAANRSYYGIETDVHITTDGKFLCMHDENTLRTSGVNFEIEKNPAYAAESIVMRDRTEGATRRDLVIPTLADYITICRDYGKRAILEIKNAMTKEQIGALIDEIGALGYLDGVTFISFTMQNLIYVREIIPEADVQFLSVKCNDEILAKLIEHKFDFDVRDVWLDSKEKVDMLHANGIKVNVWVCDSKESCDKYVSYGVDFITTDICE